MGQVTAYLKSRKRTALIDADGIIFAAACSAETRLMDGEETIYLQNQTDEEAYEHIVRRIEELIFVTESDGAIICLSDSNGNFRYDILPTYKGNRVASRRPPLLGRLRGLLEERKPWPVTQVQGLEADDVCGIAQGRLSGELRETVICSMDKDLRTIPGFYFACRMDSVVETISTKEAERFHLYQTLVGDTVDNYVGCPKIGAVKATRLLDNCESEDLTPAQTWKRVVDEFLKKGLTEEFALTQARVARILRVQDWDAEAKEVILWKPPVDVPVEVTTV